jgi:hypothetical protein
MLLALSMTALPLIGCGTIDYAPGYKELTEQQTHQEIVPTPWKPFGMTPWSYDLPDGRQIIVDTERARVSSGLGFYRAELVFEIALEDTKLVCATEPRGPDIPKTRFGCWSPGDAEDVTFWMAPDRDCPARHISFARTMKSPACWTGELTTPRSRYRVVYSHSSLGGPVKMISWIDTSREAIVQAVDSVIEMRMELYPAAERPEDEADILTLHAMALHYWHHTVFDND